MMSDSARTRRIARWKLANRVLLSILGGFLIVCLLFILSAVFINPTSLDGVALRFFSTLLYWPDALIHLGKFDCPNADSISEKLTCAGLAITINILIYSTVCFALLTWRDKRKKVGLRPEEQTLRPTT